MTTTQKAIRLESKVDTLKSSLSNCLAATDRMHDLLDSYGVPRTIVNERFGTQSISLSSRIKKVCQDAYAQGSQS